MNLTKNFKISEFACNDENRTPVPQEYISNALRVASNLQVLRDYLGESIFINSAYRTRAHNKSVKGSPKSRHLIAEAADIRTRSRTPRQLYDIIENLIREGKMEEGGLGLYNTFVHYDPRGRKVRWVILSGD